MRFKSPSLIVASLLLGTLPGSARELPYFDANSVAPAARAVAGGAIARSAGSQVQAPAHGFVASSDAHGVPTFVWGTRQPFAQGTAQGSVEDIARGHLTQLAPIYGFGASTVAAATVESVHELAGGGTIVSFVQRAAGVELFRTRTSVLLDANRALIAVSGNLHPGATKLGKSLQFSLSEQDALARAFQDMRGASVPSGTFKASAQQKAGSKSFDLANRPAAGGWNFLEPAKVKQVLYPLGNVLVPAYFVEFIGRAQRGANPDAFAYVIAGDDGRLLHRSDLVSYDSFKYRVFADATGAKQPWDGPTVDYSPSPTGLPDGKQPAFKDAVLVDMEGFNKNPAGVADPWLDPSATETNGNNVDAYDDRDQTTDDAGNVILDGYDSGDVRATTTAANTFDYKYVLTQAPDGATQIKAAITNLFYVTNFQHDWWYDSGFNEVSGNAQRSNFGRGGIEGDPLHAEAQDSAIAGQRNNANMAAMSDGTSPRMQMYLWNGVETHILTSTPAITFGDSGQAAFGPTKFDLTADVILANDGTATTSDACEALPAAVSGKIVIADQSVAPATCKGSGKAANVLAAGGKALIFVSVDDTIAQLGAGSPPPNLPALTISKTDGDKLKAAVAAGRVSLRMSRDPGIERDGDLDDQIVEHEWGHYLHHRLVNCGSNLCGGMSEGWADFNAMFETVRQGDKADAIYPMAGYATATLTKNNYYFGIRRYPYSTDMTKDPRTFKYIADGATFPDPATIPVLLNSSANSEVHNQGEIWAAVMHEAQMALIKASTASPARYTWAEAHRRISDYVVAGMKMTPVEPTYTEQRDALLAVIFARDKNDFADVAAAFAKRGFGSCAVSPPTTSTDNHEVVENFDVKGNVSFEASTLDDSVKSCDKDGNLDANESGNVTVKVKNGGALALSKTTAKVATPTAGVTFGNGGVVNVPALDPYSEATVLVPISLSGAFTTMSILPLTITLADPDACTVSLDVPFSPRINFDDVQNASANDDVESNNPAWAVHHIGVPAAGVWGRTTDKPNDDTNHFWLGVDWGDVADEAIETPTLTVSATDKLVIGFKHKFSFENGPAVAGGTVVNFDGGVIEVSLDAGATWDDISKYADPGYKGVIYNTLPTGSTNPLSQRNAYVTTNTSWPNQDTVSLDLGMALAGKNIKMRFRIGTDAGGGDYGWAIDNLTFAGITNKPFPAVGDQAGSCAGIPVANAGPDQTVKGGTLVTLDASKSSDPNNDPITFKWDQTAGPTVTFSSATSKNPTFTAPAVTTNTTLTLRVTVSDPSNHAASDTVDITVTPGGAVGDGGASGDSGAIDGGLADGAAPTGPKPDGGVPTNGGTSGSTDDAGCACSTVGGSNGMAGGALFAMLGAIGLFAGRRRKP